MRLAEAFTFALAKSCSAAAMVRRTRACVIPNANSSDLVCNHRGRPAKATIDKDVGPLFHNSILTGLPSKTLCPLPQADGAPGATYESRVRSMARTQSLRFSPRVHTVKRVHQPAELYPGLNLEYRKTCADVSRSQSHVSRTISICLCAQDAAGKRSSNASRESQFVLMVAAVISLDGARLTKCSGPIER